MIDFSTLQGLTIPEGAVTQVADASGRVLWEMANAGGPLYFRPNSDIDIAGWTLTPSDSPNAYSLLSEEVADDSSTYISASVTAGAEVPLTIGFGCENTPTRIPTITGGVLYVRSKTASDAVSELGLYLTTNTGALERIGGSIGNSVNYTTKIIEIYDTGIAKINEYVASNGELPQLVLHCAFGNGGTSKYTAYLTQAYVELTCGA